MIFVSFYILLLSGIDNVHEFWFETGAANKEAVDVSTGSQLFGVSSGHRTSILDADRPCYIGGHILSEPAAQGGMYILCL